MKRLQLKRAGGGSGPLQEIYPIKRSGWGGTRMIFNFPQAFYNRRLILDQ